VFEKKGIGKWVLLTYAKPHLKGTIKRGEVDGGDQNHGLETAQRGRGEGPLVGKGTLSRLSVEGPVGWVHGPKR